MAVNDVYMLFHHLNKDFAQVNRECHTLYHCLQVLERC